MREKIARLSKLWVAWNAKEITGNNFAAAFRQEFHYETSRTWDKRMLPQKVIQETHREHFREKIRQQMVVPCKESRNDYGTIYS